MASHIILEPKDFAVLTEEVEEEQALTMLASFFDTVWASFDDSEPNPEDYYNF